MTEIDSIELALLRQQRAIEDVKSLCVSLCCKADDESLTKASDELEEAHEALANAIKHYRKAYRALLEGKAK